MSPQDTASHGFAAYLQILLGELEGAAAALRACLRSDPESSICLPLHRSLKKIKVAVEKGQQKRDSGGWRASIEGYKSAEALLKDLPVHVVKPAVMQDNAPIFVVINKGLCAAYIKVCLPCFYGCS